MKKEIMRMGCYGDYSEIQAAHFLGMPLGLLRAMQRPNWCGVKPTPYVSETGETRYRLHELQRFLLWEKHVPRPRWHKRKPRPEKKKFQGEMTTW